MNLRHAKKMWTDLNYQFFSGALYQPMFIKFSSSSDLYAHTVTDKNCGVYGGYLENVMYYHKKLTKRELFSTVAHEMIHQYQEQILNLDLTKLKFDHGKTFQPMALRMWREAEINVWR